MVCTKSKLHKCDQRQLMTKRENYNVWHWKIHQQVLWIGFQSVLVANFCGQPAEMTTPESSSQYRYKALSLTHHVCVLLCCSKPHSTLYDPWQWGLFAYKSPKARGAPSRWILQCVESNNKRRCAESLPTDHVSKLKKPEMSDEGWTRSELRRIISQTSLANDDKTRLRWLQLSFQPQVGQTLMSSCLGTFSFSLAFHMRRTQCHNFMSYRSTVCIWI